MARCQLVSQVNASGSTFSPSHAAVQFGDTDVTDASIYGWQINTTPYAFAWQVSDKENLTQFPIALNPKGGFVGVNTAAPTSPLQVVGLPIYPNNAAAVGGGLTAGAFYRTGADPDPVCVVH